MKAKSERRDTPDEDTRKSRTISSATKSRSSRQPGQRLKALVGESDPSAYNMSQSIGFLMHIPMFAMRERLKLTLAKHQIKFGYWYYLRVLYDRDGLSQRDLVRRAGAMQPNTANILNKMAKEGLVVIERQADDRRRIVIRLTPKARRLIVRVLPEMKDIDRAVVLDGLTESEQKQLRRMLGKICNRLQAQKADDETA